MLEIIIPVAIMGAMGIVFALILYFASKRFYVYEDPKVGEVRSVLPGANCGACGYPGCDGYAEAVASQGENIDLCSVGGEETADAIADVMGLDAVEVSKYVAVVKCQGSQVIAESKFDYQGQADCRAIELLHGGNKVCPNGCLGGGTCMDVCDFDAIRIVDGLAIIDKDKCTACMLCINACPKGIIELEPYDKESLVLCSSHDKGKDVRKYCQAGCIGCSICARQYPEGFEIDDFLAKAIYDPAQVDQEALEEAIAKCPNKCISPEDHMEEIKEKGLSQEASV